MRLTTPEPPGIISPPQRRSLEISVTHIRTQAVHAGQTPDPATGAIATGIAQTTAFAFGSMARGANLFSGVEAGWTYSRSGNPTLAALEAKLAALEGGEAAATFGTGMAALSAIVFALLNPGDELAYLGPLYGGAESHFTGLCQRLGIKALALQPQDLEGDLPPRTRMLWIETPTNPTLKLHDLAQVAAIARPRGIITVADNTFCTPCLTRPLSFGLDLAYHSMTKYLGGHGDATGGAVVGPVPLVDRIRKTGLDHLGGSLAPHTAYLFLRGIKTLPLRMTAHCENAARVAAFLDGHAGVRRVYYPGLVGHPDHALARQQMTEGYGGIVSFELKRPGRAAVAAFLDGLRLFTQAVSLGDVNSLACHPASTTHSFISAEARQGQGIGDDLVRLSVGIEDAGDLIADLEQALAAVDRLQEPAVQQQVASA